MAYAVLYPVPYRDEVIQGFFSLSYYGSIKIRYLKREVHRVILLVVG
jgi:hypothetical protein